MTFPHEQSNDEYGWLDELDLPEDNHPPVSDCDDEGSDRCQAWQARDAERSRARRRDELAGRLGAVTLRDIDPTPPMPLLLDRMHPSEHTILFGDGGVGKGTLTAKWIGELTNLEHRVLILDYEYHPAEWASRIAGLGYDRSDVVYVAPLSSTWTSTRGAVWQQLEDIRALVDAHGIKYVVIDSVVAACLGHDVNKPETSSLYAGAIQQLGLGTLSLAHVTKQGNPTHPFGSAFWHNFARVTWSATLHGAGMLLKNRKSNQHRRGATFFVESHYSDDGRLLAVEERPWQQSLLERVLEIIEEHGPLTYLAITQALNADAEDESDRVKKNSVEQAVRRDIKRKDGRLDYLDHKVAFRDSANATPLSLVPAPEQTRLLAGGNAR